jgi:hypothetical protein
MLGGNKLGYLPNRVGYGQKSWVVSGEGIEMRRGESWEGSSEVRGLRTESESHFERSEKSDRVDLSHLHTPGPILVDPPIRVQTEGACSHRS